MQKTDPVKLITPRFLNDSSQNIAYLNGRLVEMSQIGGRLSRLLIERHRLRVDRAERIDHYLQMNDLSLTFQRVTYNLFAISAIFRFGDSIGK